MDIYVKKRTLIGHVTLNLNRAADLYAEYCIRCENDEKLDFYLHFEEWLNMPEAITG